MTLSDQYPWIMQSLKKILKSKGISYKTLALQINISESGVKKIFSSKDCSFGRLNQICRIAGVSLGDLIKEQDGSDVEDISYTGEQQQYFLKNRDCLNFFWKLAFERLTVSQIQTNSNISDSEALGYLKKLDNLKLITLDANKKIRIPKVKRIRSFGKGPLIDKIHQEWSVQFMKEITTSTTKDNKQFIIRYLRMKNETYSEFLAAIREVEHEFLKRAVREMSLYESQLNHVRWVSAIDQESFVKDIKESPFDLSLPSKSYIRN